MKRSKTIDDLVSKTVKSVEKTGDGCLDIEFTDGTLLSVSAHGGGFNINSWLSIYVSDELHPYTLEDNRGDPKCL